MVSRRSLTLVVAALALAACTLEPPAALERQRSASLPAKPMVACHLVMGVVSAPAAIISNNGGSVISNNGGSLISDKGGGYKVASVAEVPLAGVTVFLADATGKPVPGLLAAKTDANGRYEIQGVPPGFTFLVKAEVRTAAGRPASLCTLVRSLELSVTANLTLASTLVSQAVIGGSRGELGNLEPSTFVRATETAGKALVETRLPDLADAEALRTSIAVLASENAALERDLAALRTQMATVTQTASELQTEIEKLKAQSPLPASPNATATPFVPSRAPTATPAPGATAPPPSPSPTPAPRQVTTLAGRDPGGWSDGQAATAQFNSPMGVAVDGGGTLFVADMLNYRVRAIAPSGAVSTLAGSGLPGGSQDGVGAAASLDLPYAVAFGPGGALFVAEYGGRGIRRLALDGTVTTLVSRMSGQLSGPTDLVFHPDGNFYVCDADAHRIVRVSTAGVVSTFAGSGVAGLRDGTGTAAQFNLPSAIALGTAGDMYVVESHAVRKVTAAGVVTTVAGSGVAGFADGPAAAARFNEPYGVAVDGAGNVYVSDTRNHRIRMIAPNGTVSTVAGGVDEGWRDGEALSARLSRPGKITLDSRDGSLVFTDTTFHRIRRLR